ncbi:MAG TPA: YncE family protein [Anaeromyxobacteraceae bacterium]|nr:YncE family protein [Anaeromyxobacteraceae bacterium]
MRRLMCLLLSSGAVSMSSFTANAASRPSPPLAEVQVVALPGVQRRIDHFAVDSSGQRLFVAALGHHTLEVLDLVTGRRITNIPDLNEPQGVAYLPSVHRVVVATRAGGTVTAFDDRDYRPVATISNMPDADNLRFDAAAGQLYVGHGDGALGVIDPASMKVVAEIPLPGHPESFQLEHDGPRIFVNVPPTREILVVDRTQRSIVTRVSLGSFADNYPMSLDERSHRLFVAVRHPARFLVFDTRAMKELAAVPCVGDSDDVFYDAARDRVYVIGGEGYVDVFDASSSARYARVARIPTRAGARTGLWSNELARLFVGWPQREGHPAKIQVLGAPAGQ